MRRQINTGFTLIEILIALFVFTILSMIMVSALHSITNSQTITDKRAERLSELQMAFIILSQDFEQTLNRPVITTNGLENALVGAPQSVSFTRGGLSNPTGEFRSTLQRVQYRFENHNLLRITWPTLDHSMKVTPDQRVLISNVSHLQFEYLDDKNIFIEKWPAPNKSQMPLPKAVRVSITLRDSGNISQLYVIPAQPADQNSGPKKVDITT